MPYIGKSPTGSGVRQRYHYTATGGETSLSGADDNSKTLKFTDGEYVDVYLNGVLLVQGTDYGVGTANTISSLAALAANDIVEVIVYDIYNVAKINSEAVRSRHYFTATGGETSIGTSQIGGLSFPANADIDVKLNGVTLVAGTDYNTTTANTVGGLTALTAGQVVEIVIYEKFQLADTVSKASGGTFNGPVTFNGDLNAGTIKEATGTTEAISIDSSGRVQIKQNNTATVSAPSSGSMTISGIPDWANKITLVTDGLSPDTTGGIVRIRVTVGGSIITTAVYKYNEFRTQDTQSADIEDNGSGINYIETVGFNNVNNSHDYIFTFYKVDDYTYKFHGNQFNQYFSGYAFLYAGTITTTGAIDGFNIIPATGNFDAGKAKVFWE